MAGSGGSEALVRRFVSLVEDGVRAEHILLTCRTRAGAARLRERVETLLVHPHEELWIGTYAEIAERILRQHPTEAGLDPFFTTVTAADRLAILLDRVDDLPLRRHEIRGNPAGLLARLLRRIDLLKLEAVTPERLRDWASASEKEATRPAQRERARREAEFAELYARHDRVVAEAGSLDEGDLVLEGARLLADRADVQDELTTRFEHVMVDELEEAAPAHMRLAEQLVNASRPNVVAAHDPDGSIRRFRGAGRASLDWFRGVWPDAATAELPSATASASRWRPRSARSSASPRSARFRWWLGSLLAVRRGAGAGPGGRSRGRGAAFRRRDASGADLRRRRLGLAAGETGRRCARGAKRALPRGR